MVANSVLCDVVHDIYQDILYLQNIIRFHGTSVKVITFRCLREVCFLLPRILRDSHVLNKIMFIFLKPNGTQTGQ